MNIFGLICIFIFSVLWTFITKKYLPKDIIEGTNKKIDERQTKIILEAFSYTLVWTVYALILAIILKLFGIGHPEKRIFPEYPEVSYLIIIIIMLLFSFVYTKYKYSAKG